MAKHRVQLFNQNRSVEVDTGATPGAVVGVNLTLEDGRLVTPDMLFQPPAQGPSGPVIWRTILERPKNVDALGASTGSGLYVITGDGTSEVRAITGVSAEIAVSNGNGVSGNPSIGLADLPDLGGGSLLRFDRDAKGRVSGTSAATTDDLAEGIGNLYFTEARVLDILAAAGAVIPSRPPVDGEILEYDDDSGIWTPTLHPRKFFIDGGNF